LPLLFGPLFENDMAAFGGGWQWMAEACSGWMAVDGGSL
jgi:hypothetical protein